MIQQGPTPDKPAPPKNEFLDRKGRMIETGTNPTTERWKRWSADLAPAERSAIEGWSLTDFGAIRRFQMGLLRQGTPIIEKTARQTAALQRAVEKAPVWQGPVWRGVRDLPPQVFEDWKTTGEITFEAFASTSTKRSVADVFTRRGVRNQVLIKIRKGSGVWIKPISQLPNESEVLYEKGQRFQIISRKLKPLAGGVSRLELEVEEII